MIGSEVSFSATRPDIIVSTDGLGADFTLPSAAYAAGGTGKSYFIKAGIYVETADVIIPSNTKTYFEEKNGGVIINFNNAANTLLYNATAIGNTLVASLSGAVFGNVTNDLTDLEANPSLYKVAFNGAVYQVLSASDSGNTITLSTTPPLADAGSANYIVWSKNWSSNVVMEGLLTLQNSSDGYYYLAASVYNSDYSRLRVNADHQIYYLTCANVDFGTCSSVGSTLDSTSNKAHYINLCSGVRGRFTAANISLSDAGNLYGVLIASSEMCSIDVNVSSSTNPGAGAFIGIDGTNTKRSTAYGVISAVDTTTANVSTMNTAALRIT